MKTSLPLSLIIGLISLLGCSDENGQESLDVMKVDLDTIVFEHSMKGWELYSWPNGNNWYYSILVGTNRLKTYQEVTHNSIIVMGVDSLKLLLDKLPPGEEISWIGEEWLKRIWGDGYGNLSLPDELTRHKIKAYCLDHDLVLNIIE